MLGRVAANRKALHSILFHFPFFFSSSISLKRSDATYSGSRANGLHLTIYIYIQLPCVNQGLFLRRRSSLFKKDLRVVYKSVVVYV